MTTMTRSSVRARRRLDLASLALLIVGIVFGVIAYALVRLEGSDPLIMVPAVVAATLGISNLTKRQAEHDR